MVVLQVSYSIVGYFTILHDPSRNDIRVVKFLDFTYVPRSVVGQKNLVSLSKCLGSNRGGLIHQFSRKYFPYIDAISHNDNILIVFF